MRPDEERLPPAYLVPWQAKCHWIALKLLRLSRNSLRRPSLHLLPLLSLPALRRWGPAAGDVTEYRRLSSSACGTRIRALSKLKSSLSSAATLLLRPFRLLCADQSSTHILSLHCSFMSITLATPSRCASLPPWMRLHGCRSPHRG